MLNDYTLSLASTIVMPEPRLGWLTAFVTSAMTHCVRSKLRLRLDSAAAHMRKGGLEHARKHHPITPQLMSVLHVVPELAILNRPSLQSTYALLSVFAPAPAPCSALLARSSRCPRHRAERIHLGDGLHGGCGAGRDEGLPVGWQGVGVGHVQQGDPVLPGADAARWLGFRGSSEEALVCGG